MVVLGLTKATPGSHVVYLGPNCSNLASPHCSYGPDPKQEEGERERERGEKCFFLLYGLVLQESERDRRERERVVPFV